MIRKRLLTSRMSEVAALAVLFLGCMVHPEARAATSAQAQTSRDEGPRDALPGRGNVSLLLNVGGFSGLPGVGIAVGSRAAGVRISAGWAPTVMVLDNGTSSELKLYGGLLVAPDVYLRAWSPLPTSDVGVVAGYRYSSLLGHGVAAGAYAQFGLAAQLDLNLSFGFLVFPDGEDRLKREENLAAVTRFSFPGPTVNLAFGASFAFFP
jgi:hypothetical protein